MPHMSQSRLLALGTAIVLSTTMLHAQQPSVGPGPESTAVAPASQQRMPSEQSIALQQAAIAKLSKFDGIWEGTGSMLFDPKEGLRQYTHVVRVGSAFDGMLKEFEVYGYTADGRLDNHQLSIVSYDPQKQQYTVAARASSFGNSFNFRVTDDGYVWAIGSEERGILTTGSLKDGVWTQLSQSVSPDRAPVQAGGWTLHRVSGTNWPEGTVPKPPKAKKPR